AGHLGERRGEARRAAVLERLDEPALDELDRGLDQLLPHEGVADLHRRALLSGAFPQLLTREDARAADSVAAGRGAEEEDEAPRPARPCARDALAREEADAHRVHEAVLRVDGIEDRLAAHGRDADAVAVVADPGDGAAEREARLAEAEAVEERDRPRTHRDDVAKDPADTGRGALERLDGGRVVVALDLEGHRLTVTEVDHARVLARSLEDALATRGQPPEQERRVLVAAVLRPEEREDGELEAVRRASEELLDPGRLGVRQPEGAVQRLRGDLGRQGSESIRVEGRVRGARCGLRASTPACVEGGASRRSSRSSRAPRRRRRARARSGTRVRRAHRGRAAGRSRRGAAAAARRTATWRSARAGGRGTACRGAIPCRPGLRRRAGRPTSGGRRTRARCDETPPARAASSPARRAPAELGATPPPRARPGPTPGPPRRSRSR